MKRLLFLLFFFHFLHCNISAQTRLGDWQVYFPFANGQYIETYPGGVYLISASGIADLNLSDGSYRYISILNGLSDIKISAVASSNQYLVVGYSNGNIDLMKGNTFYNISDIKRKDIQGKKAINNICIQGDKAWLACDFGIVAVDLIKNEIKETYYLTDNIRTIPVNDVAVNDNLIYAATSQGVYYGLLNTNLLDFANWQKDQTLAFPNGKYRMIRSAFNQIIAVYSSLSNVDSVYYKQQNTWKHLNTVTERVKNIKTANNQLVFTTSFHIAVFNQQFQKILQLNKPGMNDAVADGAAILIANPLKGITRYDTQNNQETSYIPSCPTDLSAFDIKIYKNKVYMVPGGRDQTYTNIYFPARLSRYKGQGWDNYTQTEIPELAGQYDLVNLAIDPWNSDHVYAGSWGNGIFEFNFQNQSPLLNIYNEDNSENALQNIGFAPHRYVRIGGMAFDRNKNLWIANAQVANPIVVLKSDGHWKNFSCKNLISGKEISQLIITSANYLWAVLPRNEGLFVMDFRGTIDNEADDRYAKIILKDQNGEMNNDIYSIAEDLDGTVWIGTATGILVYYSQEIPFSPNPAAHKLIIEKDGIAQYLLGTEQINAIVVDDANRKWIGTQKAGVFLISADGTKQLMNFSTANSPLPSNNILAVSVNRESGDVFFGTENGVVSFRSSAIISSSDFNKILIYPNPVRENYQGPLMIKGLMYNTLIKITDIDGNLVYEMKSEGGQAAWNMMNFTGHKVSSGVYLVFCSNADGSTNFVEKVLIMNQK